MRNFLIEMFSSGTKQKKSKVSLNHWLSTRFFHTYLFLKLIAFKSSMILFRQKGQHCRKLSQFVKCSLKLVSLIFGRLVPVSLRHRKYSWWGDKTHPDTWVCPPRPCWRCTCWWWSSCASSSAPPPPPAGCRRYRSANRKYYLLLRRFQGGHHEYEGIAETEQRLDWWSEDESLGHFLTGVSEIIVSQSQQLWIMISDSEICGKGKITKNLKVDNSLCKIGRENQTFLLYLLDSQWKWLLLKTLFSDSF